MTEWMTDAEAHAREEFPREACGLVVLKNAALTLTPGQPEYFPCRNMAQNQSDFIMDPQDYAKAEDLGQVVAVFHSHPNAHAKPSQADLVACETSGLPWHILSLPSRQWHAMAPTGYRAPLIGRQYAAGVLDCYTIVLDWYRQERGIELLDFERTEEQVMAGMYLENFHKAGFVKSDGPLEVGDVILMQIRAKDPNHGAVYIGNDKMLHHLAGRLSSREIYGGWWRKVTRLVVRYAGAP